MNLNNINLTNTNDWNRFYYGRKTRKEFKEFMNKINEKRNVLYIDTNGIITLKDNDYSVDKGCCCNCHYYWAGYDDIGNEMGFCRKLNKSIHPDISHNRICYKFKKWYLL